VQSHGGQQKKAPTRPLPHPAERRDAVSAADVDGRRVKLTLRSQATAHASSRQPITNRTDEFQLQNFYCQKKKNNFPLPTHPPPLPRNSPQTLSHSLHVKKTGCWGEMSGRRTVEGEIRMGRKQYNNVKVTVGTLA
jgi:hypothetical protein